MQKVINYWKEEEGYNVIHDDNSFCAYDYYDGEFFIAHFYVTERKGGASYKFFDRIKEEALKLGATRITGNLDLNNANRDNYHNKLMIHLRNGYKVLTITNNRITVIKHL